MAGALRIAATSEPAEIGAGLGRRRVRPRRRRARPSTVAGALDRGDERARVGPLLVVDDDPGALGREVDVRLHHAGLSFRTFSIRVAQDAQVMPSRSSSTGFLLGGCHRAF